MVHQAQAHEVGVARALGDLVAPPEVVFRFVEPLPVRARHAEVVVGDRAPVLVVRLAVGLQGAPVARQRFVKVPLNVREDTEVCSARAQSPRLCPPSSSARRKWRRASATASVSRSIPPSVLSASAASKSFPVACATV